MSGFPNVGSACGIGAKCQVPISGTAVSRLTLTSITYGRAGRESGLERRSAGRTGWSTVIPPRAHRLGHLREVRVPELAGRVLHEARPDLAAVHVEALEVADHADRVVVEDHPDGRDVVLGRRRDGAREHHEAAVARDADGRLLRPCELQPEHAVGAEAHAGEAARREDHLRPVGVPVLLDPGLVVAGVGDHQRVVRRGRAQLLDHAARVDRHGVGGLLLLDEVRPLRLPRLDLVVPAATARASGPALSASSQSCRSTSRASPTMPSSVG